MMNSRLVKTLKLCLMVLLFNPFYSFLENLIGNQQTEFDQNSSENDQQYILKRNLNSVLRYYYEIESSHNSTTINKIKELLRKILVFY